MKTKTHGRKSALKSRRPAASARNGAAQNGARNGNGAEVPGDAKLEAVLSEVSAENAVRPVEDWASVECPYCGEGFEVRVTSEQDGQTIAEDCQVCSRTVLLGVEVEDGEIEVEIQRG